MAYEIFRAIHILSMIAWIAAMLFLPRLLVYRMEAQGPELAEKMDLASARLVRIILTPSMVVTWMTGLAMIGHRFGMSVTDYPVWLWSKLVIVVVMTALHGIFTLWRRKVAASERPVSIKAMRLINEIPFVLVILIVLAVIVEPEV